MRPATRHLRLPHRSCPAPASLVYGGSCNQSSRYYVLAHRPRSQLAAQGLQPRLGCRLNSTAASPAPVQDGADNNNTQSASNIPSILEPYPSHLKRRGPFSVDRKDDESTNSPAVTSAGSWNISQRPGQLILGAQHYGKWKELIFDYDRLMFESGLVPSTLSDENAQRSVDRPENASDMGLWSAIFNFAQRRGDSDGALVVWREIFQRRQLYQVDGVVASAFWTSVLGAALEASDESFLESTWAYAEWMHDSHRRLWPHYYRLVVSSFLDRGDYNGALQWHLRLSPHFSLPKRDFFDLLKTYITDSTPELQETLQYIYATGRHRALYDIIVPLLWSRGYSALARNWRRTLVRHDDLPTSSSSRPFLQFVAGYYPETELTPQEQRLVNMQPAQYLSPPPHDAQPKVPDLPTHLYHLMNRVHGETFGIQEKSFNDRIGAKWFATRFVSLETAINLIYSLGIEEIGPLSLQSIALRGGDPASVLRSLEHLEQCHIGIGKANYSKAIRHFARMGDAETLSELLHSTLHPDIFDDIVQQRAVLGAATYTGDWKTYRLVLTVRLAISEDALETSSNELLLACLRKKKKDAVLRLLDEFSARGMEVTPATFEDLSRIILEDAPRKFDPNAAPDVDFYAALCRRLLAMRLPVPTEAWQNILLIYGRLGRLTDLEKTTIDLVDQYVMLQNTKLPRTPVSSPSPFPNNSLSPPPTASSSTVLSSSDETTAFKAHISDVPDIVRGETSKQIDLGYRLLPRDLPFNHPLHPLSLIFSEEIVASTVRWYFHRMTAYRQKKNVRIIRPRESKSSAAAAAQELLDSVATSTTSGSSDASSNPKASVAKKPYIPAPPADSPPGDFSLAGGIRLLAMLRSRGIHIPMAHVRSETLICIVAIFGPESMSTRYWQPSRAANQLKLGEVKAFCDAAWASGDTHESHLENDLIAEADLEADTSIDVTTTLENPTLLPKFRVLKKALAAVKPVAASFANQITRPGDKKKASRDAFLDIIHKKAATST